MWGFLTALKRVLFKLHGNISRGEGIDYRRFRVSLWMVRGKTHWMFRCKTGFAVKRIGLFNLYT